MNSRYKAKEIAGSVGKDSRGHQEERGGRGNSSQGQQNESPMHFLVVSRQREDSKDSSWDLRSRRMSSLVNKSPLFLLSL